jgi:hypothetical protein
VRVPVAILMAVLMAGCGSTAPASSSAVGESAGTGASGATSSALVAGSAAVAVGPVSVPPSLLETSADPAASLNRREGEDRARARVQAGFVRAVGSGWVALSATVDQAIDAAAGAVATDLDVQLPTAALDRRTASIATPSVVDPPTGESAASALAIVTAALTAGQALGKGGTTEASKTATRTTTDGDDVATVTVVMKGTMTSTGSRVVAEFTFDLSGDVRNTATGATARMTGSATARVEIDGCPDTNGSSKGKVNLSSKESVTAGTLNASWTRDLSGDFDISVNDSASIAGLSVDASAQESMTESGGDDPDAHGHDLGITAHYEAAAGPGFSTWAPNDAASDGDVTNQKDATLADLQSLMRGAAYAINASAVMLGQAAETFWRDGRCVELLVDPEGGDVDADSVSDVVAKVKHRFEGNELDKPVEATLTGVAKLDPVGQPQPAPATVRYTAGSEEGDVGEIAFKTTSNRGIAEKSVKFTVHPTAWTVAFSGTDKESFGPVVNSLKAAINGLRIVAKERALSGSGTLRLSGTVTSGPCRGPLDQTAQIVVSGSLVGIGPEAKLHVRLTISSPPGSVVHMRCQPGGGADIPAEGHAERFGDVLKEIVLPLDGTLPVNTSESVGGVLNVALSGTFTVTPER